MVLTVCRTFLDTLLAQLRLLLLGSAATLSLRGAAVVTAVAVAVAAGRRRVIPPLLLGMASAAASCGRRRGLALRSLALHLPSRRALPIQRLAAHVPLAGNVVFVPPHLRGGLADENQAFPGRQLARRRRRAMREARLRHVPDAVPRPSLLPVLHTAAAAAAAVDNLHQLCVCAHFRRRCWRRRRHVGQHLFHVRVRGGPAVLAGQLPLVLLLAEASVDDTVHEALLPLLCMQGLHDARVLAAEQREEVAAHGGGVLVAPRERLPHVLGAVRLGECRGFRKDGAVGEDFGNGHEDGGCEAHQSWDGWRAGWCSCGGGRRCWRWVFFCDIGHDDVYVGDGD